MRELVWSNGPKPDRSSRADRPSEATVQRDDHQESRKHEEGAVMTALEFGDPLSGFRVCNSCRDDANAKIGERELIGRVSYNPFMAEDTYLEDLTVEDSLLRPRNSKQ